MGLLAQCARADENQKLGDAGNGGNVNCRVIQKLGVFVHSATRVLNNARGVFTDCCAPLLAISFTPLFSLAMHDRRQSLTGTFANNFSNVVHNGINFANNPSTSLTMDSLFLVSSGSFTATGGRPIVSGVLNLPGPVGRHSSRTS